MRGNHFDTTLGCGQPRPCQDAALNPAIEQHDHADFGTALGVNLNLPRPHAPGKSLSKVVADNQTKSRGWARVDRSFQLREDAASVPNTAQNVQPDVAMEITEINSLART